MFCPSCGAVNERDAEKCINCGKPLPRLTPAGELENVPAPSAAGVNSGVSSETIPGSTGPKAGSPGSQYSFTSQPDGYNSPYQGYTPPPGYIPPPPTGYAPYYNYSLPVDRVGVAPAEVGFWPRLGAYVIDNIITSFITGIVVIIPLIAYSASFFSRHQTELLQYCDNTAYGYSDTACRQTLENILVKSGELGGFVSIVLGLVFLATVLTVLYYTITTARGATVGKKVFGMRVVTADGQNIGFGRSLLRHTVGYFVSGLVFGLGFLWIGFDPHKQGWHDKIAGTYVVRN